MKLKNARTCAGCYAYEQNQWGGATANKKGYCILGFDVEQIKRIARQCGKDRQWMLIFCKPAEPCMKPLTESDYVKAFKERHEID